MEKLDNEKMKKILNLMKKKSEEWFTINQVAQELKIHVYKMEVLMYKLFYKGEIETKAMGKYTFWRIKKK